jgi:hypothetical protein
VPKTNTLKRRQQRRWLRSGAHQLECDADEGRNCGSGAACAEACRAAKVFAYDGRSAVGLRDGSDCGTVLTAGGFEPVPCQCGYYGPSPVFKALASKEAGPPQPRLDTAALEALVAREAGMNVTTRMQSER